VANRDGADLRRFVWRALLTVLLCSAAIGGLLLLARQADAMPATITPTLLGFVVALLMALTALRIAQECLRAAKRITLSQVVEQLAWPLALLCAGGASVAGLVGLSLVGVLALQLGLYGLAAIILIWTLFAATPYQSPSRGLPPAPTSQWFLVGVPLALAAALSVLLNRGDILALGAAVSAAQIAPYTAASRYAALLVLGQAAASAVAAAVMRDYWREGDRENLQHAIDRTAGVSAIFALPLAAVFIALPEPLLRFYGSGYVAGDMVLRLLAIGQLVNALTGPVALIVIVCDLARAYTIAMIGAVVLQIALLGTLIPRFGTLGAASAALIALTALNLGLAVIIKQKLGLRSWATPGAVAASVRDIVGLGRGWGAQGR
jgi:O-antigen/teichoic acid export membrane protein